jgi:DNA-binding transcriptional MerR regulator
MFRIGDFSKLCRVPSSALRYYADIGLLKPAQIDAQTGYRYYSLDQLPRLNRILALKDLGLSLEQIARLLDEAVSPDEIRGMLRLRQSEIQQRVDEEQARLARVAARLRQIEQEGSLPALEVILKPLEPMYVLSIREIAAQPEDVGTLLGEACTAIIEAGIPITAPPLTLFHDQEFKPNDLDVEIAIPVTPGAANVALSSGRALIGGELPGTLAAAAIHTGSYDNFAETYSAIARWIEQNGYQIAGASREVYLSAPDDESGAITEIQYPVEKV